MQQDENKAEPADRSIIPDKPKRVSRILTLVPKSVAKLTGKSVTYDLAKHADQERFLSNLADSWHRKLRELKREIKIARDLFKDLPRGTTLCGCSSFRQFCEDKLHISRQGVYDMLGDYHEKRKAKKQAIEKDKRFQKMKPGPSVIDLPGNREAAVLALSAVARFRTAKTEEEKTIAWAEYEQIADGGLKSVIDGDHPNYQHLLANVLVAAKKLEDAALQMHGVLTDIVTSGMLPEHTALLASTRMALSGAEELLEAGKELAAIRKRFNIRETVN